MIILYIIKDKKETNALIIHALLGIACVLSPYFFVFWFYLIVFTSISGLAKRATRSQTILLLSGYLFGLELIGRMVKASPFVPYQVGNYGMLFLLTFGIINSRKTMRTHIGNVLLFLCIPAFFMIPAESYVTYFINSFSGILILSLGALYFRIQSFSQADLRNFIKITVLPTFVILIYLLVGSPSLDGIEYGLAANFDTTGGFGSNQVSVVLGTGACLLLLQYIRKKRTFKIKYVDIVLIGLFLFRGILTFSRGGVIGGIVVVLISYLYISWNDRRALWTSFSKVLFIAIGAVAIFYVSDQITGGVLFERYQGETAGTLSGTREKTLNTITSNRSKLIETEWKIFTESPILGVGPGNGYEAREKYMGIRIASHTELTRLLAEQGVPGLFIALILIIYPYYRFRRATSRNEKYYIIAFFALAIITSTHAGMRTLLTPLFWSLGCAKFSFYENNLPRKLSV